MSDVSPELPLEQRREIALGQAQSFNAELEEKAAAVRQQKKLESKPKPKRGRRR